MEQVKMIFAIIAFVLMVVVLILLLIYRSKVDHNTQEVIELNERLYRLEEIISKTKLDKGIAISEYFILSSDTTNSSPIVRGFNYKYIDIPELQDKIDQLLDKLNYKYTPKSTKTLYKESKLEKTK